MVSLRYLKSSMKLKKNKAELGWKYTLDNHLWICRTEVINKSEGH